MDRPTNRKEADARGPRPDPIEAFVLPSRRPALDLCGDPSRNGAGPILLTGDAGVGKTWLWRRLMAEAHAHRRCLSVDLTPANDPADFYSLIAHELGLLEAGAARASRIDLVDFLADRHADGERVALVIEEAHNLSIAVWEEVRVLANRLNRPGGFSAMFLVGQTALARRLTTRPLAAIEARLAAKVHLGPIDVDEAREWLSRLQPGRGLAIEDVEALHRDSAGNPRQMLRRLGSIAPKPSEVESGQGHAAIDPPKSVPITEAPRTLSSPVSLTGPDRPPIRVEENMIEVGWSAEDSAIPGEADGDQSRPVAVMPVGEEAVKDHYAALQAWREWTENQGLRAPTVNRPADQELEANTENVEDDESDLEEERSSPLADRPSVWADGEQRFAPFSQLFTRMSQARETE